MCIDYFELVFIFCIKKSPIKGIFQIFRVFLVLFFKVKVFFFFIEAKLVGFVSFYLNF